MVFIKFICSVTELLERAERIILGRQKELNRPKGESLPAMVYVYGDNKVIDMFTSLLI